MASSDPKDDFILALSSRLENILPNRSGYIIAEVELNAQFILTSNLFLSNCKPNPHNGYQNFMPNIIEAFSSILEKLNIDPHSHKLRDREDQTLTSTLVAMKLLAAIVRFSWDRNSTFDKKDKSIMNEGISFNSDLGRHNDSYEYYSYQPLELQNTDVHHTLDVLFCLMSEEMNREALATIRRVPVEKFHPVDYTIGPDSDLTPEEVRSHIREIDSHLLVVLRYIAASNPIDYFSFLHRKLFAWAERGEYIPTSALQRYSCLLKFLYHTADVVDQCAKQIYSVMPYIRSNSWKQLLLFYDSLNVQYQCLQRTQFYLDLMSGAQTEENCKILFDYVASVFEDLRMVGVSPSLHSWFVILCPSDFEELLHKPNKLKQAFNKRLKFLTAILRDSQACVNLESFESLTNIFLLGARIAPGSTSGVREFSLRHLDETFENLQKMYPKCANETAMGQYRTLLVDLFIAAIVLNPKKYIGRLEKMFLEGTERAAEGCQDYCSCREVQVCIKVVKGLSEVERFTVHFQAVMSKLYKHLKALVFSSYRRLDQYESARLESSSSSSIFSTPTERIELEKNTTAQSQLLSTLKKSKLEHGFTYNSGRPTEDSTETADASSATEDGDSPIAPSNEFYGSKCIGVSESIMADLFQIFAVAPELYFSCLSDLEEKDMKTDSAPFLKKYAAFSNEISRPIKQAINFNSVNGNTDLFESACALAMTIVDNKDLRNTPLRECTTLVFSHLVVKAIADACTLFSLTDPNFKLCFIFLNKFLQKRDLAYTNVEQNNLFLKSWVHVACRDVSESLEILMLLALCTHDVQFFGMAKITMKWHIHEVETRNHPRECLVNNLSETFKRILDDDSVFTGFVSLHKKFRSILMEAMPTRPLYHVWLLIYQRWLDKVEGSSIINDDSLVFRHFTGFLVSTSGCFFDASFAKNVPKEKDSALAMISAFFGKAISLLKSSELVIRVVIKDALSNESHPAVFHLICTKLMNVAIFFFDQDQITQEGILYIEQMMSIITAMVGIKNDGAFVLVSLLPGVCEFLIKFINVVPNPIDLVKLKLRFCKLGQAIESNRFRNGIEGAYKLRAFFAKSSAEWLEQSIFYNEDESNIEDTQSILTSPTTSTVSSNQGSKNSELEYLYVELASECSKCLELQLQESLLEVPEGTKDKNIKQSKDLIFSNYFSLFLKILQKFTLSKPTPNLLRSKYKIQGITDNVLKCISNVLRSDTQIGVQFVLPLGYHENKKIRAIFLNVFADILSTRKLNKNKEEFPDDLVFEMSEIYTIYGSAAEVASPAEHNLLANSLYGLFVYTKKLDKLFVTLLTDEIGYVARSTDIFRRNSTLTRLMSIFAKEYGVPYLTVVLKPFIEEIMENNITFEVEKSCEEEDVEIFMRLLTKLVDVIVSSTKWVPESFRFICSEIYRSVKVKFDDAAVLAVGSFVFLRFFCPAIVSPESFFDLTSNNIKVKRSLIQLVKVIQYMANGSLAVLKWPGLLEKSDQLFELNRKIFAFLEQISNSLAVSAYAFDSLTTKPYTSLRYIHKFIYTYFIYMKHQFILGDPLSNATNLHERVETWRKLDKIMKELGLPKPSISLQGTTSYKAVETGGNLGNSQYAEFMAKMSVKNIEMAIDCPIIHSSVFHDGTPVVTVNFRYMKEIGYDMSTFVYLILEAASQVWDNKFYTVFDFTQFFYMGIIGKNYVSLMKNYAPAVFFKNCSRTYYFNLPRIRYLSMITGIVPLRVDPNNPKNKMYFYSQADKPEIINSLCLEESVVSINRDVRVIFNDCQAYDESIQQFVPVTLKLGRKWMQICFERVEHKKYYTATDSITPVETHLLSDLTGCEISSKSQESNEFTLSLNRCNYEVTIVSPQRLEILRFLYFAMLRNSKQYVDNSEHDIAESNMHWFGRLYNIVFHGLLELDDEVRSSASYLFASLARYFDVDFGISPSHARRIALPVNTTDFVVSVSTYLSKLRADRSYRFIKAFFNNFDKLPEERRVSGIMYISPWIDNVGEQIFMDENHGAEKVADIVRQFCRITTQSKHMMPFMNDYIWKKLFADFKITPVLLDEIVGFAIDNKSDSPEWGAIISIMSPSVELCGEVIGRIIQCIHKTSKEDSDIASQSKLLEIMVLVKICASMFFNSYVFGSLYLLDVFFFCTLFIDNPTLEFGSDLQKLVINTIQSFIHKPNLSPAQAELIDNTIEYFSGQRARMLFGLNSRERISGGDINQAYNRATSFDRLCDNLNEFIAQMGSADDKTRWMTRWCSLAMDITFSGSSLFQRRAILVVGTLARSGISDSASGRILRLLCSKLSEDLDYMTYAGICYARLEEGLSADSAYLPLVIWAQIASGMLEIPSLYQSVATCLANTLGKLEQKAGYLDHVVEQRRQLEPLITNFEEIVGSKISRKNFEFSIMFTVCQALTLSQFRHTSITCLKKITKQKFSRRNAGNGIVPEKDSDFHYLFMLFLSASDSSFQDHVKELSLNVDDVTVVAKHHIPNKIMYHMSKDAEETKIVLILAAYIFESDCDSNYRLKFISFFSCLFKWLRKAALLVFHIVKAGLQSNLINSVSIDLVNEISDILVNVIHDESYSVDYCEAQVNTILASYSFERLKNMSTLRNSLAHDNAVLAHAVYEMLYRSFSSVIEGQRLETF